MSTISTSRTALPAGTWRVDTTHSTVGFSVKHMVVANFRGWNAPLPTGGFAVGNDVKLVAELELIEQA